MADENVPADSSGDAGPSAQAIDMALGVPDNGVPIISPASLQASGLPPQNAGVYIQEPATETASDE